MTQIDERTGWPPCKPWDEKRPNAAGAPDRGKKRHFEAILSQPNSSEQSNESRTASGTVMVAVETEDGPVYQYLDLSDFFVADLEQGDEATHDLR